MENELFGAKNAKLTADLVNDKKHNAELTRVLEAIKKIAAKGDYTYYDGNLMPQTIAKLKELGYKVEQGGRMDEIEYNITWK